MSEDTASRDAVAEYISGVDSPQREVIEALRALIIKEAPIASETVKWGQPCYSGCGIICAIAAEAGHVKLGLFRGEDLFDPEGLLEGAGKKMRHIKVRSMHDIRADTFASLIREAFGLDQRQSHTG